MAKMMRIDDIDRSVYEVGIDEFNERCIENADILGCIPGVIYRAYIIYRTGNTPAAPVGVPLMMEAYREWRDYHGERLGKWGYHKCNHRVYTPDDYFSKGAVMDECFITANRPEMLALKIFARFNNDLDYRGVALSALALEMRVEGSGATAEEIEAVNIIIEAHNDVVLGY